MVGLAHALPWPHGCRRTHRLARMPLDDQAMVSAVEFRDVCDAIHALGRQLGAYMVVIGAVQGSRPNDPGIVVELVGLDPPLIACDACPTYIENLLVIARDLDRMGTETGRRFPLPGSDASPSASAAGGSFEASGLALGAAVLDLVAAGGALVMLDRVAQIRAAVAVGSRGGAVVGGKGE